MISLCYGEFGGCSPFFGSVNCKIRQGEVPREYKELCSILSVLSFRYSMYISSQFLTCALSEVISKSPALLTMVNFYRMKPYCVVLNNWRFRVHLLALINNLSRISPSTTLVTVPTQFQLQRCAISLLKSQRTKKPSIYHNTLKLMSMYCFHSAYFPLQILCISCVHTIPCLQEKFSR